MKFIPLLAAAALAAASGAQAQAPAASAADHAAHHPASAAASAAPLVDGEVRKIDKAQGKLTLRHGPLPNLDMPAMTMVFRMAEPKLLDTLKEGDKVKFTVEKVNGAFTVTSIRPAQ